MWHTLDLPTKPARNEIGSWRIRNFIAKETVRASKGFPLAYPGNKNDGDM